MSTDKQQPAGQGSSIQGKIEINAPVSGTNVSIGHQGHIEVISGAPPIDREALKGGLEELYTNLAGLGLPTPMLREVQRATDRAAEMAEQQSARSDELAGQIKEIAEALKRSGGKAEQGSSVARSIARIAGVLAPVVVGGAHVVAAWFGLPLP